MDTLKEKLAQLVYDYSIKGKFADKVFFINLIELCIDAFDIYDYVYKYEIAPEEVKSRYASYNIKSKKITMDINKQRKSALSRINGEMMSGINSTQFLICLKVNLDLINGIVHELTHACQYKKCLEGNEDLERELLELSLTKNLSLIRGENLSEDVLKYYKLLDIFANDPTFYISLPSERMANIRGLKFERDISKLITSNKKDNIEDYMEARLLLGKMQAYHALEQYCPTTFVKSVNEELRKQMGLSHNNVDLDINEGILREKSRYYSLDSRLFLGLPISNGEKKEIDENIKILKKSLF